MNRQFYHDNYQQYERLRTQLEEEGDLAPIEVPTPVTAIAFT